MTHFARLSLCLVIKLYFFYKNRIVSYLHSFVSLKGRIKKDKFKKKQGKNYINKFV